MMATPDISHLSSTDYNAVYEPAEDSFLLIDALEKERDLIKSLKPTICLEVGSGSGIVITFLASMLGTSACYFCTDINPRAAEVSRLTGEQNKVLLHPVLTDLCSVMMPRFSGLVDILVFNPPYVVTPSEEVGCRDITASWAGGNKGREVMDRLFPLVPRILSQHGVFYLLTLKENDEADICRIMDSFGLSSEVIMSRRSGPEFLSVWKFQWRGES